MDRTRTWRWLARRPRRHAQKPSSTRSAQPHGSIPLNTGSRHARLRAILAQEPFSAITRPMVKPALDVLEDLWQLSHITPSYVGRAVSAAILLAYGMFENSAISIIASARVLPFLSQVVSV